METVIRGMLHHRKRMSASRYDPSCWHPLLYDTLVRGSHIPKPGCSIVWRRLLYRREIKSMKGVGNVE